MTRSSRSPACPRCGSTDLIPIVYGYPGGDLMEDAQRGIVMLGGCCITEHQPTHGCRACGRTFEAPDPP